MKSLIEKIFNTKISTSYMFILFGVSALMLTGYFSYAWFTVQGVQKYSVVTGNLNGTVAIGTNSIAINGQGVITYTPTTDSDTITLTVTNTNDRTVKNSIYYYNLSDSTIQIGYTSDSPTIPNTTGVSVAQNNTLTYKIKINKAKGKQIKIGSSIGLSNSNLTLPSGTTAFSLLKDQTGAEILVAKANPETLDYNTATTDQKNQMWAFSHEATEQLKATTDYRYIGKNPNNYVKFNDELWRIIGVFDVDDGTGKIEKRMKIIRNKSIGSYYSWDNKDTSTGAETDNGKNNWSDARLNYLLNPGHESETYGGSLYWNGKSGTCYASSNNGTTSCNLTYAGLTDAAKLMIGDAKWYIGGSSTYDGVTSTIFYTRERGTTVYSGHSTSWTGKVGLMYPSDYGYATSGGNSTNRASCMAKALYNWDDSSYSDCKNNDWLYNSSQNQWTISPGADGSNHVFRVDSAGYVLFTTAHYALAVRPVVHLKSTIKVISGTGSSTDPFILG